MKKTTCAIFGRHGRRVGFLGLGATTLLTPARVLGGMTLAAAGTWAIISLHPHSDGVPSAKKHVSPQARSAQLHHAKGTGGDVNITAAGGNFLLARNHVTFNGKGAKQTPAQPTPAPSAIHSSTPAAGSWLGKFGRHAGGAPISGPSTPPAPPAGLPGVPKPHETPHASSGPDGNKPPVAPWNPKKPGTDGQPKDAPPSQPAPNPDHPIIVIHDSGSSGGGANPPDGDAKASPDGVGSSDDDPDSLAKDTGDPGSPPGDPEGVPPVDLGGVPPADPELSSLPDTFDPPPISASDLLPEPGSDPGAPSGFALLSVPEPTGTALFGIGLLGLGWARRRFHAAAKPGL